MLDFYGLFVLVSQSFFYLSYKISHFLIVYYVHFLSAILGNNIYFKSLRKDDEFLYIIYFFAFHITKHNFFYTFKLICVGLIGFL